MHGTPAPALFSRARRDFSHGCIRLEDPVALAVWVLRDQPGWTRARIEAAMQANNKVYEKVIYPNADHAFHNDTGTRYNSEAARDAWARTLAWFEQYLKTQ